jgi:hypothetical protein
MLAMTQKDYSEVYDSVPRVVATRMGLDEGLIGNELINAIQQKDGMSYNLMMLFRKIYKKWWDKSKELESVTNDLTKRELLKNELRGLISSRNEIRNSLLSYLNSTYGIQK